jgi:hypothetical protein
MMKSLRCGVFRVKEIIMTTSKIAVAALAIALATTTGFAIAADKAGVTGDQAASAVETDRTWYQASEFKLQAEQARAELERQGFPQYNP